MNINKRLIIRLLPVIMAGCSGENSVTDDAPITPTPDPPAKQLKINISTTVESAVSNAAETTTWASRATDSSFEYGDFIGLFVVNHNADGTPGTLMPEGNHVDNMKFTYNGTWTPASPLYWKDDKTHADFYAYYRYQNITSTTDLPISIYTDQYDESNYKANDFMLGSALNVTPSENAVNITLKHMMSLIIIKVEPGNGFTTESLAQANISVKINNIKTKAKLNMATATLTAESDPMSINPMKTDEGYKALVPPQSVSYGDLITITIDGKDFNLKKAFKFVGGKIHKFTVTPTKTSNGINVNISQWENDDTDNGGNAE